MSTTPRDSASPPTRVRYVVLAALCSVALITYVQRMSLVLVEKEVREEFKLTRMQSSWVSSSLFISYALFQVPGGWIGYHFGSRRALAWFTALCSGAMALFAFAGGFATMCAARFLMGYGQAGVFPCTTGSVKSWFPVSRMALANGGITGSMQVGALVALALTAALFKDLGREWTFLLFAIPGIIWAICFFVWFRDNPAHDPRVNAAELALLGNTVPETEPKFGESIPWMTILTSPPLLWVCSAQFFRGAGFMFYGSWFATFLREGRGVKEISEAGLLTSWPYIGTGLGSLAGGWFSDWLLVRTGSRRISRQGFSIASQLAAAALILIAYFVSNVSLAVLIISGGSFCAALGGPVSYTVTIDIGGKHVPTVFGLMNMFGNLGALAFPPVVAWLVGEGANANWNPVVFLFAGIYIMAAACWVGFNPERTIFGPAANPN